MYKYKYIANEVSLRIVFVVFKRLVQSHELILDLVHLRLLYLVKLHLQRQQDLLPFFFGLLAQDVFVLVELFINEFVLLPHLNAQQHQLNSVDVNRRYLRPVCHQEPRELLESLDQVLLLFADIMNELADASLDLRVSLDTALEIMVLKLKKFVKVGLHLVLHLHGLTQELLRVNAVLPVLTSEFKFLQLLAVSILKLSDGVIVQQAHTLPDLLLISNSLRSSFRHFSSVGGYSIFVRFTFQIVSLDHLDFNFSGSCLFLSGLLWWQLDETFLRSEN